MTGAKKLPGRNQSQLPAWYYLGEQAIATPANQALTLPSECSAVTIAAETGAVYYAINHGVAAATSGGFVATNTIQTIGPIANLTGIRVTSTAGTAHVTYWREA